MIAPRRLAVTALVLLLLLSLAACKPAPEEGSEPAEGGANGLAAADPNISDGEDIAVAAESSETAELNGQPNYYIPKKPSANTDAAVATDDASGSGAENPEGETEEEPVLDMENPENDASAEKEETPAAQASEPYVLTISGSGVEKETAWTLNQLQNLRDGLRKVDYSTTSNWPRYGRVSAEGVSLIYLLNQAGLTNNAVSFRLCGADGNYAMITYSQMFGESYSYANHSVDGSSGPSVVEPVIAWAWNENGNGGGGVLRSFFGQRGPLDVNTTVSIENLYQIEVVSSGAGKWAAPTASLPSGNAVNPGADLQLGHNKLDSVHIYYTTDGSEPNYNSNCYNPSASYLQPELQRPLKITENITVKAFAAAYGMEPSPMATFYYSIE